MTGYTAYRPYTQAGVHIAQELAKIKPGQLRCAVCGHIAAEDAFRYGDARLFGRRGHSEQRYCPNCGKSIDWNGCTNYETAQKYLALAHTESIAPPDGLQAIESRPI